MDDLPISLQNYVIGLDRIVIIKEFLDSYVFGKKHTIIPIYNSRNGLIITSYKLNSFTNLY